MKIEILDDTENLLNKEELFEFFNKISKVSSEEVNKGKNELLFVFENRNLESNKISEKEMVQNSITIIDFRIVKKDSDSSVEISSKLLNFKEDVNILEMTDYIKEMIAGCLGYKKCTLNGLSVKNKEGNKIKPAITIFVKWAMPLIQIDKLEYLKEANFERQNYESEFYSDSIILNSIISNKCLFFKDNSNIFKVETKEGNFIISQCGSAPIGIACAFTSNFAAIKYLEIIKSKKSEIIEEMVKLLKKLNNKKNYKNFLLKITKNVKYSDFLLLYSIVEHSPMFNDFRDNFIKNISVFLLEKAPFTSLDSFNTSYLKIRKKKVPASSSLFSLKKFLTKPHEKRF